MNNNKKLLVCILAVAAVAAFFLWLWVKTENKAENKENQPQVCLKNDCFNIEIAKTETERERGLMFRQGLAENSGMLFIFEKTGVYPFWMKNTFIPLDMVWISEDKKVVFIHKNAQPCVEGTICEIIDPRVQADYVLEMNAGESDKAGISVGDKANLKNI